MNKLISVIIPAYNASGFIEETINSVIIQSYNCFELIIVNDGSTDNTIDIIHRLSNTDKRIRVIEKKNEGVCKARNDGYNISKGEFILFLDADDVLNEFMFEICMGEFHKNEQLNVVYTKGQIIDENSVTQNEFIEANTILDQLDILKWKIGYVPTPSCTLIKREVMSEVGFWDTNYSTAADQDFFIRISTKYAIVGINQVLFFYRIHPNNMHQNISTMEKDHIAVFQKALKNNLFPSKSFKRACFSNLYLILAGSWWKNGKNKTRAFYFLFKAIFEDIRIFPKLLKKVVQ